MLDKLLESYREWRIRARTRTWNFKSNSHSDYLYNILDYEGLRILLAHPRKTRDVNVIGYLLKQDQKNVLDLGSVDVVAVKKEIGDVVRQTYGPALVNFLK